jgi:hypothetical protein
LVFVSASANAFWDEILPKPVFSIPQGLEIQKMNIFNSMLLQIDDVTKSLQKETESLQAQVRLLTTVLGGPKAVEYASRDSAQLITFTINQWLRNFLNRLSDIFGGLIGKFVIQKPGKLSNDEKKVIKETVDTLTGMNKDADDAHVLYYYMNFLRNTMDEFQMKYAEDGISRGKPVAQNIESPDLSLQQFIKMQQENLTEADKCAQKADNASVTLLLQLNLQMQMQNNQISLKILEALADQNRLKYYETMDKFETIKEKVIQLKEN